MQLEKVELANSKFESIEASVEELNSILINISSSVQQQSMTQIALNIENVAGMSSENSGGIEDMIGRVESVVNLLQETENELKKFKLESNVLPLINAKVSHVLMVRSIFHGITNNEDIEIGSYENCEFTSYFKNEGMRLYGSDQAYTSLDEKHRKMHEYASKLAGKVRSGGDYRDEMTEFQLTVEEFIEGIDVVISKYM